MLGELLEVVTKLSEVSDRLQQAGEARRKRIADYFLSIEKCLCDSVEQLKNNQVPNSRWGELKVYARKLQTTIGKEIGKDTAEELSLLLLSTAKNIPTNKDIPSIETAAGTFKGLANTITTRQNENNTSRRKLFTYTAIGATGLVGGLLLDSAFKQTSSSSSRNQSSSNSQSADQFPTKTWTMHTFLSANVEKSILWKAPEIVCNRVRQMTNDRFFIDLKRTGETEEILTKVSNGEIQCGYSGIYYTSEPYKALFFGCAVPFGLNPQEQNAWLSYKKNPDADLTYIQSIYKSKLGLNVIPFPAGATGVQMGGWFNKEVNTVSDLQGLVMRIPGLGADVLREFGVKNHRSLGGREVALDEAIRRLKEQGENKFDAVEWTGPWDDRELGLPEAAEFYYYPGWWEPGTTFDVQVNIDAWDDLPPNYQEIFKVACYETHTSILTEYERRNSVALKEMLEQGVQLRQFSSAILTAAEEKTKQLLDLYAGQNETFKEVYDEWRNFKEQIQAWSKYGRV